MVSLRFERKPEMRRLRLLGNNQLKGTGDAGRGKETHEGLGLVVIILLSRIKRQPACLFLSMRISQK
jgi:hypothetical protein